MKAREFLLKISDNLRASGNEEVCRAVVIAFSLIDAEKELDKSQRARIATMIDDGGTSDDYYAIATKLASVINSA